MNGHSTANSPQRSKNAILRETSLKANVNVSLSYVSVHSVVRM